MEALFDLSDLLSLRDLRRLEVRELKARHGIHTNGNGDPGPAKWIAFSAPECHASEALKGYLDPKDIADPWEMYFSYLVLMWDEGLISEGATEYEAVQKCAGLAERKEAA